MPEMRAGFEVAGGLTLNSVCQLDGDLVRPSRLWPPHTPTRPVVPKFTPLHVWENVTFSFYIFRTVTYNDEVL